jgi:hypothetical protein
VGRDVKFLLSQQKDVRLNVRIVLGRDDRSEMILEVEETSVARTVGISDESEEILTLHVLTAGKKQQFLSNRRKENQFSVETVIKILRIRKIDFRFTD